MPLLVTTLFLGKAIKNCTSQI